MFENQIITYLWEKMTSNKPIWLKFLSEVKYSLLELQLVPSWAVM